VSNNEDWFYEVGYRKPPRRSQFQRGRSGNPKGRPKRSSDSETLFRKTLLETVVANENGRQRKMTKVDAIVTQLVNKAALGDHRSTALLLRMIANLFKSEKPRSGLSNEAVDMIYDRLCGTVPKAQ
jgi:hypothetical protein